MCFRPIPTVLFVLIFVAFASPVSVLAQGVDRKPQLSQFSGELSQPFRSMRYPEAPYPDGIMPDWDRGYIIHHEIGVTASPDLPNVTMYDAEATRVLRARVWVPGAAKVSLRRAAATQKAGVLTSGGAVLLQDGSIQHFIAKTDSSGKTIQSILTGSFLAARLCEAEDGTVWSLGTEINDDADKSANVLRQFSFNSGLLRGYLPLASVQALVDSDVPWFSPDGSRLQCGQDKISAYLEFTDEYVEINSKSFAMRRWKLDLSQVGRGKANGLAVTDDGRVYLSLRPGWRGVWSGISGLFEVKADPTSATAMLLPIKGTVTLYPGPKDPPRKDMTEPPPRGTFCQLWGAYGNDLAVVLADEGDVSWVRVVPVSIEGN